jgi:hypothetical protein
MVIASLPSIALGVNSRDFHAKLNGYQEIITVAGAQAGAVNTNGFGVLKTHLNDDSITFRFEFSGLTSNLVQAHYHFGQEHTTGGVMVFLCGPAGSPAKQACPAATFGVVSGTLVAGDVIGPGGQNILAGDLTAVLNAIRNDAAYANLHSVNFPGGEIRGHIKD